MAMYWAVPGFISFGVVAFQNGFWLSADVGNDLTPNEVGVFVEAKGLFFAELCDYIEMHGVRAPSNSQAQTCIIGKYPLAEVFRLDILRSHVRADTNMVMPNPPTISDHNKSSTHPDRYVPYKIVPFRVPNSSSTIFLTVSYSSEALKLTYTISTYVFYLYRRRSDWQTLLNTCIAQFNDDVMNRVYECSIFQVPIRSCKITATGEVIWRTIPHQEEYFVRLQSTETAKEKILANWFPRTTSRKGKGGYLYGGTGVGKTHFVQHLASHCKAVLYEFRDDSRNQWPALAHRAFANRSPHIICMFDEIHRIAYGAQENDVSTATLLTLFIDLLSKPNILVIALCNTEEELRVAFGSAYAPLTASHRLGAFRIKMLPITTKSEVQAVFAAIGAEAEIEMSSLLVSVSNRFPLALMISVGEVGSWFKEKLVSSREQANVLFAGAWPADLSEYVRAERLKQQT